jgi:phosphonate transport system permease protein
MSPHRHELASNWRLKPVLDWRSALVAFLVVVFVAATADRMRMTDAPDGASTAALSQAFDAMFPLRISERTPIEQIDDFDPQSLPPFARVESETRLRAALNPQTLATETEVEHIQILVEPFGYLFFLIGKLLSTVEIAVWATGLAAAISAPLAVLGARSFAPHPIVYGLTRGVCSFLRAVPELISALFLVLVFGFGPLAGMIALALHGVGFLGKFYADDLEHADPKPQDALKAMGASWFARLRIAVLPQIAPNLAALTIYILDRNIRMAAVIGLVGAGGIGLEFKERFELMQYDRVGMIVLLIFLTILALDLATARLRTRLMEGPRR